MFQWIRDQLTRMATRRKQKDAWSSQYTNDAAAKHSSNLPLDPSNDPWVS